jgi:CubicO group peptidase (beta-lactamase class C family)
LVVLAFIVVASIGTGAHSFAPPASTALDFARLEERLESLRARSNVPGMVAGVARGNLIVWTKGFGYADLTTRAP